jgi:hypothetical protein
MLVNKILPLYQEFAQASEMLCGNSIFKAEGK